MHVNMTKSRGLVISTKQACRYNNILYIQLILHFAHYDIVQCFISINLKGGQKFSSARSLVLETS